MTDEEIAAYANIPLDQVPKLRRIMPKHVVAMERMREFERQWNEYLVGLGPRPTGVLIDEDNRRE